MTCLFCSIVDGTTSAAAVYQDDHAMAFLDTSPLFPGHVLVVPCRHVELMWELPSDEVGPFFSTLQRIAIAIKASMGAEGIFIANNNLVSQSVPHMHVHVVPRSKGDGLKGFFWPRSKYETPAHLEDVAARIRACL